MKRLTEREPSLHPGERALHSIRVVMARMSDVIWQADPAGNITGVTQCRPSAPTGEGQLDDDEVQRVDHLWSRCVRCVERLSTVYHIRRTGSAPQMFQLEATPVLDARDSVLYWTGSAIEIGHYADAGSVFISEATALLSSSLNRGTIANRLTEASVDHFCDVCAVYIFDDDGTMRCESFVDRRSDRSVGSEHLHDMLDDAVRTRKPLLFHSQGLPLSARSMIVVPLLVGSSCIGTLSFLESQRLTSFGARDVDVAMIVGRQLAMALENIKTFEREQQLTERFRFMARVTDCLFTTLDQTKMLESVLEALCDGFADYGIAAAVVNGRLRTIAAARTKARFRETAEREIHAALQARRSILAGALSDVGNAKRLRAGPFFENGYPRSWMMAPLFVGDTVYGALICCSNSHAYDAGELELYEEIGRRVSLALEHAESFARERRLIQTLQKATLPTRLATVKDASLSAVYRAAALEVQVGGDWYDAYDLDEHRVLLTVGDVTGHGLEASIIMGKLRHAINVVAMYESDPVQILDAAERVLLRRYPGSVATAFVAIFDARSRTLTYANAGHPYPMLRTGDGCLKELQADGLPIGLRFAAPSPKPRTQRLDDATLLALYTDGLTEATRDPLAGERLLRQALATDAVFYVASPAQFIEEFCLREQAPDDVAILALNFVNSARWEFDSGDWRAARKARREFLELLAAGAEPNADIKAAELIFGELAANVAQHVGGKLEIALEWSGSAAVLHVIDRGPGSPIAHDNDTDPFTEHGRGLWLVQRFGAQITIEALPGFGNHVRAVLPICARTLSP